MGRSKRITISDLCKSTAGVQLSCGQARLTQNILESSKTVSSGNQTMSTPVGHAHQFLKLTQAPDHSCVELIRKRGIDVLNDSALNKVDRSRCVFRAIISRKQDRSLSLQGTGFSLAERERLGLRGLLPPRVLSADTQVTCAHKLRG